MAVHTTRIRSAAGVLLGVTVVLLVAIAVGRVGTAVAAAPSVTITSPLNGSISNEEEPSFRGLAEEVNGPVTLTIYGGSSVAGPVIQEAETSLFEGGIWSLGPIEPLADGTYTARAAQTLNTETGTSPPVTFTVDTAPPTVTLKSPESPSDNATPSFTGTASEATPVTVQIHAGATAGGTLVSRATATGTGAAWSSGDASPALPSGEYTAVATQPSSLGNKPGRSAPMTFTVIPAPIIPPPLGPAPPAASFKWFPSVPDIGEPVLLVSSSTDAASPITAFAWALASGGPFQIGGAALSTSFSTAGAHLVRLVVTNADGLSSTATETIDVVDPTPSLMQPFPVVRIAGTDTGSGVKLKLLEVEQTPAGAVVTVRCKGRGCPMKSASHLAVSTVKGVAPIEFRKFERSLRSGITLEILVSKLGEIGKYTRFTIRRGKLPQRVDMCLEGAGLEPVVCPAS